MQKHDIIGKAVYSVLQATADCAAWSPAQSKLSQGTGVADMKYRSEVYIHIGIGMNVCISFSFSIN